MRRKKSLIWLFPMSSLFILLFVMSFFIYEKKQVDERKITLYAFKEDISLLEDEIIDLQNKTNEIPTISDIEIVEE